MSYVLGRLREPSTWAGIAAVMGALRINISPGVWSDIATAGMALAGLGAAFTADRSASMVK